MMGYYLLFEFSSISWEVFGHERVVRVDTMRWDLQMGVCTWVLASMWRGEREKNFVREGKSYFLCSGKEAKEVQPDNLQSELEHCLVRSWSYSFIFWRTGIAIQAEKWRWRLAGGEGNFHWDRLRWTVSGLGKSLVLLFFGVCSEPSAIGSMEGKRRYISHRGGSYARLEPHNPIQTSLQAHCKLQSWSKTPSTECELWFWQGCALPVEPGDGKSGVAPTLNVTEHLADRGTERTFSSFPQNEFNARIFEEEKTNERRWKQFDLSWERHWYHRARKVSGVGRCLGQPARIRQFNAPIAANIERDSAHVVEPWKEWIFRWSSVARTSTYHRKVCRWVLAAETRWMGCTSEERVFPFSEGFPILWRSTWASYRRTT